MIRDYLHSDYELLNGWWKAQNFQSPPEVILPQTGYIANECAAGFLYLTNARVSWVEWVVADPKAEKKLRAESINEVIAHIEQCSKFLGNIMMFTSTTNFPFAERLRRLGFAEDEKKTSHFVKVLGV